MRRVQAREKELQHVRLVEEFGPTVAAFPLVNPAKHKSEQLLLDEINEFKRLKQKDEN